MNHVTKVVFLWNNLLFWPPPKHWQTCILVNKLTIFWDKYSSNIYCARGSYITCLFCDLVSSPFIWWNSKKTASGPNLLTVNEEAQVQWKSNLIITLLWIHKQNLLPLSIHNTIFSCEFSFKTSASGNFLIVSSSSQFSLGTYFYHCTQTCPPIREETWLLLLRYSWLAAHFSETALTVWIGVTTIILRPGRGKTTQEVEQ